MGILDFILFARDGALGFTGRMNKILPFCPKCQKPLSYVDKGYINFVERGGPSHEAGAIAFACPECRTLLSVLPNLEQQISEIESLVQDLPGQSGQ